jgi:hypothetical protein
LRPHRPQKRFELRARLADAQSVQVEPRVDGQSAAAKSSQHVQRQVDASPFDSLAVVGHLEPGAPLDQYPQVLVNCVGFGLFAMLGDALDPLRWSDLLPGNAAGRSIEWLYAREEPMQEQGFVIVRRRRARRRRRGRTWRRARIVSTTLRRSRRHVRRRRRGRT